MVLVDLNKVTVTRPTRSLFEDLSVTISAGDRVGIVGINGTGKSTLLRVILGTDTPESGTVRRPKSTTISMLDQEPDLGTGTVRQAIGEGWEGEAVLDRLGMGGFLDAQVANLSGGQAKRVALARTLVSDADLLILDEPTNHLDIDAIAWLEARLATFKGGLVLVTHDRHLLDRVTTRILELDRGHSHVHDGGYASYLEAKIERRDRAATEEAVRKNLAKTELAWLRRGAPARTRKPKARIAAAEALTQGGPEAEARKGDLELHTSTPRLGRTVVELEDVTFGHGDDPLFRDVEVRFDPLERLGIVGSNGTGKTTLLDIIAKRIEPWSGDVTWGTTVELAYYRQHADDLDPNKRVIEVVAGDARDPDPSDKALCSRFWFDGDVQRSPVSFLSGGERRRLQLIAVLAKNPNVLLLDEPTNDFDIDTLRILEDFLDDWPGALVVVSHDRAFLDRTVTDVLVLDGEGTAARRPGGYASWLEERLAARNERPAGGKSGSKTGGAKAPKSKGGDGGGGRSASTLRHEVKAAEKELAKLTKKRDAKTEELLAAGTDHEAMARVGAELTELEAGIAAAEERWMVASEELEAR